MLEKHGEKHGLKVGATLTGAMIGWGVTGDVHKGMLPTAAMAGGVASDISNKLDRSGKRKKLAKEYNNYKSQLEAANPSLSEEDINEEVRNRALEMLTDDENGPTNDSEKALYQAAKNMASVYKKDGLSEDKVLEAIKKDFDGIENGSISEMIAPVRFFGNIKNRFK